MADKPSTGVFQKRSPGFMAKQTRNILNHVRAQVPALIKKFIILVAGIFVALIVESILGKKLSWAKKTNQAVYETPFDLGAGGASLTMAAKEGRIFANPALLPYGGSFHQWAGLTATVLTSRDSASMAQNLVKDQGAGGAQMGEGLSSVVDRVTQAPVHLGVMTSLSWLTRHFALCLFDRVEPDLKVDRFGESGLPEVRLGVESYHGLALGTAVRTPLRWLSLGVTFKQLYVAEPEIITAVLDESALSNFEDPSYIKETTQHHRGTGADLGFLIFFQDRYLDIKMAGKIDDLGHTRFADSAKPSQWRQVVSAGLGLTLHSQQDAFHIGLDYRDIFSAYEEPLFKKVYAGVRLTWHNFIGLSTGIYHGYPTYGIELDALVMRFSATLYRREFSDTPGFDSRNILMGSISLGY